MRFIFHSSEPDLYPEGNGNVMLWAGLLTYSNLLAFPSKESDRD